jgi:hypothetical protein
MAVVVAVGMALALAALVVGVHQDAGVDDTDATPEAGADRYGLAGGQAG